MVKCGSGLPGILLASLILLTSGQRTANNKDTALTRDGRSTLNMMPKGLVGVAEEKQPMTSGGGKSFSPPWSWVVYSAKEQNRVELARQNRITQEILEHYLQKRLFPQLARTRPPSVEDILPQQPPPESETENVESLQSVESEQVNSVYEEDCPHCEDESTLGINRWTMPLLKLGEKRYYLGIFFKANWFKAAQYCRFHGMHLASISSQEENDKLEKYVRDSGYGNEHFWTSGTDQAEEGSFFWMSSGRPITFTNWNAGEPNNFRYENGEEENCMELWNRDGKGLKWNDSPCSFETFFVCEVRND